ncbi:hypothetical protein [Acetobacter senegalensis]|uniref:hypothetical protein n=1 Tax=Acetobacter senegalensis TaxID=446692 RepID=UPI000AFBDD71|nr:hypothetical protein [Acetobacter senegalensis]
MFCLCRIYLFQICPRHPLTILSAGGVRAVIALDLFGLPFSGMAVVAVLLTGISH